MMILFHESKFYFPLGAKIFYDLEHFSMIFIYFYILMFLIVPAYGKKSPTSRLTAKPNKLLSRKLQPQAAWSLRQKKEDATVIDVVSVLGRFSQREDFYQGSGYRRPLLTKDKFYESIRARKFKQWPLDESGNKFGTSSMNKETIDTLSKQLASSPVSEAGCNAVFTSFAKGAENGVAYPAQVDEQMSNWRSEDGRFNLKAFELSLLLGRFYVALGWFLYIGLQFGGVYVVFFFPIMSQFFPDVDFFPLQTYLRTSQWFH